RVECTMARPADGRREEAVKKEDDMQAIATRMLAAGAAAVLLLGGCGRGGPQAQQAQGSAPQAPDAQRDFQARLAAMPEGERNAVFIRAVRDAGSDCQHVGSSTYQGISAGAPTWVATCDDGNNWVVMIGSNGSAQVIKGSEIEAAQARARQAGH
ncbi:MAG: hypothetical protein JWN69_761, partial [Alphaproteobacteria bacterium]|nr:hypothetical protein [Alphaproteobacteria bacterium]